MNNFGDCSSDTIPAEVPKKEVVPDETVPVLFLSTALSVAAMHMLKDLAGDSDFPIVMFEGGCDTDVGLDLEPGMAALDEKLFHLRQALSFDMENDVLPELVFEALPYWQQVNGHPRGPGPKQRKGGKHFRAQKLQR